VAESWLLDEVSRLSSLGTVLRWAFDRRPPGEFIDSVAQDEYTHDVVVRLGPGLFLVFDTT
jgi:hypothetical protein